MKDEMIIMGNYELNFKVKMFAWLVEGWIYMPLRARGPGFKPLQRQLISVSV